MCPLCAPRLELYVAGLEMFNASRREHDSSDLFRRLVPSLRAALLCDFSEFHLLGQCRNLIRSHLWEGDLHNVLSKRQGHFVSGVEGCYQRIMMRPASVPEKGRASEKSPAIWRGEGCYGV